jgi:hypothetical protein
MLQLILISVVIVALLFAAIGLKMLFNKEYEAKKTCSSNIVTKDGQQLSCGCGGGTCATDDTAATKE